MQTAQPPLLRAPLRQHPGAAWAFRLPLGEYASLHKELLVVGMMVVFIVVMVSRNDGTGGGGDDGDVGGGGDGDINAQSGSGHNGGSGSDRDGDGKGCGGGIDGYLFTVMVGKGKPLNHPCTALTRTSVKIPIRPEYHKSQLSRIHKMGIMNPNS